MRLVVDVAAWDDLNHIGAWIAKDNPRAAPAVLEKILQTIEHLNYFPRLARVGRARGTYERIVAGTPYIIVFELRNKPAAVVITAVAHGAQTADPVPFLAPQIICPAQAGRGRSHMYPE